jgi:hypothetical protein
MTKVNPNAGQMGGVPGNRPASATRVPIPNGKTIIRSAGAAVNAKYREVNTPKPRGERVTQNWRKG